MKYDIRNAKPEEFNRIGNLMVNVYSQLDGFPKKTDQPKYYSMLANIGEQTLKPDTQLLAAISDKGTIGGVVVYFSDMKYYGSGGSATSIINASGFRLLAVDESLRGQGIGKLLSMECINKAKEGCNNQIIIHSTKSMNIAWRMYEKLGFVRSKDLDFMQGKLPVFGFRLLLNNIQNTI
jgi:GNAT superfamily N-acetyltransferase